MPGGQPTAQGVARLMSAFNSITGAMAEGQSRQQVWDAARAGLGLEPRDPTGATIFDMNYVWGQARGILNATASYDALGPGDVISADQIASVPWERLGGAGAELGLGQARVAFTAQMADGTVTQGWWQLGQLNDLNLTRQQMDDFLAEQIQISIDLGSPTLGEQLGALDGARVVSIDAVQLMRW